MKLCSYKTWKQNQIDKAALKTKNNLSRTPCPGKDKYNQNSYESGINYLSPVKANIKVSAYVKYLAKILRSYFNKPVKETKVVDDTLDFAGM